MWIGMGLGRKETAEPFGELDRIDPAEKVAQFHLWFLMHVLPRPVGECRLVQRSGCKLKNDRLCLVSRGVEAPTIIRQQRDHCGGGGAFVSIDERVIHAEVKRISR